MNSRKVAFLIPASPTGGFMSQVAAFSLALKRLTWRRWQPMVLVCFGEGMDREASRAYLRWRQHLQDVTIVFAPESAPNEHYYNQIDGLYRWAPKDADALVRVDADTLPIGELEEILDLVAERSAIAGTIAHFGFPLAPNSNNRDAWLAIAKEFLSNELRFDYEYSLADANLPLEQRVTPYYLNDGLVIFSREYFDRFSPNYLEIRPLLMKKLAHPYFAGQVALALAVARIDLPAISLPLRYNFPNDVRAAERYPDELSDARFVHYLRTKEFDRQKIFQNARSYARFIHAKLNNPNSKFRNAVRDLFGVEFPFDRKSNLLPEIAMKRKFPKLW